MIARSACLGLLAVWCTCAPAAEDAPTPQALRNPQVLDKLLAMGEHLRALPRFEVNAEVERDVVLEDGQKLKMHASNRLRVEGRNHLYARWDGDTRTREFFYNGRQLTQYAPYLKYYSSVEVPDNLLEMLHRVEEYYGVQLPMEDLFLFGRDQAQIDALQSAVYVGPSSIDGKLCDHLAFRQAHVDWQLWISRGERPLPCKLVITTTDDASHPEYSAVYRWNLAPVFKAGAFTFRAQRGDVAIPLKRGGEGGQ